MIAKRTVGAVHPDGDWHRLMSICFPRRECQLPGTFHDGAATPRTHPNHQRRQRLHRGAMDHQPASSALVAARAATATLTQRYGLRRGGRRYLHRRRRLRPPCYGYEQACEDEAERCDR
jgi:hypothetical protein